MALRRVVCKAVCEVLEVIAAVSLKTAPAYTASRLQLICGFQFRGVDVRLTVIKNLFLAKSEYSELHKTSCMYYKNSHIRICSRREDAISSTI